MTDALSVFASGVRRMRARDLAVYAGAGIAANALFAGGFPKVGGMLSAMALATYIAGVHESAVQATDGGARQ
jgi:hypothetical protein